VDGNFVQKFQAAGWDALLWELYARHETSIVYNGSHLQS
jgi:hypothetical protein